MIFADLLPGDSVFIDANIFVYHFAPDPILGGACSELLQRVENEEVFGYTATHILTEISHRLMTMEACSLHGWAFAGIAARLRRHADEIRTLTSFQRAIAAIINSKIQALIVTPQDCLTATSISAQCGLLSSDALVVAVMQSRGLTKVASHDSDFDRVSGVTRYAPA